MISPIHVIIPILNEKRVIQENLQYLKLLNSICPILFVDGNSKDGSEQILKKNDFEVIKSRIKGRGAQMSFGAVNANSQCEILLFLHIDTRLPDNFNELIVNALKEHAWGRFEIKLNSNRLIFKVIQFQMNLRSKITSIVTGDQSIYVKKDIFLKYADEMKNHPLMEDIYLSKVLKKHYGHAKIINQPVTTSVRYWLKHGIIQTIIRMWVYRLLYFFGVSPQKLYQIYYN